MSQINPFHAFQLYFLKIQVNKSTFQFYSFAFRTGVRGGPVCLGNVLKAGRFAVSITDGEPLTEMITRNNSWEGGKGGRQYLELKTLPSSCAKSLEIWESQSPGTLWACPGL
jgi:hypothetical protein